MWFCNTWQCSHNLPNICGAWTSCHFKELQQKKKSTERILTLQGMLLTKLRHVSLIQPEPVYTWITLQLFAKWPHVLFFHGISPLFSAGSGERPSTLLSEQPPTLFTMHCSMLNTAIENPEVLTWCKKETEARREAMVRTSHQFQVTHSRCFRFSPGKSTALFWSTSSSSCSAGDVWDFSQMVTN